ncbi:MAG: zinc ABC transporter solute-binding protein [Thermoplasmatales archaeon]|nr:zinc ABC transporter solute-binding protein [Thermoplasmatales archaeon]
MSSKALAALTLAALLIGTGGYVALTDSDGTDDRIVCVTMPWQGEIVDCVSMGTITVKTMVKPGADPHSAAPEPGVILSTSKAMAYFTIDTGVEWEAKNVPTIEENLPNLAVIPMARNIELLEGGCHCGEGHEHAEGHGHAMDPHVWTSPKNLSAMASNVRDDLKSIDPGNSATYDAGYLEYENRMGELGAFCAEKLAGLSGHVLVWHGAWKYLFNDYTGTDGSPGITEEALQHIPGIEKSLTPGDLLGPILGEGYEFFYHPRSGVSESILGALRENGVATVVADPTAYDISEEIRGFVAHLNENPPEHHSHGVTQ